MGFWDYTIIALVLLALVGGFILNRKRKSSCCSGGCSSCGCQCGKRK